MDPELCEARRRALVHPADGSVRLAFATKLLRAGFRAAARHELVVALSLGERFSPSLGEAAALLDSRGVEWSFVDVGWPASHVALVVPDARSWHGLVSDGERLVQPALITVVCRECREGLVPCGACDEDNPDRFDCTLCRGTAKERCERCRGEMLLLEQLTDDDRGPCPHRTRFEARAPHHRWSWSPERCVRCGILVVRVPNDERSSWTAHAACSDCGYFACHCQRSRASIAPVLDVVGGHGKDD